VTNSLASLKNSGPTGLMFHHFHGSGHLKSEGSFSADEFGRSLDHASKVANLLSADVFLEKALSQKLDETDICCSFDDGLQCQFDVAASVLASKKLKAFFFVNTGPHAGHPYILEIFRIF
jgi:peptidoglycan/xylan/chitin deacetylase (PgdA/CDA1 family)